MSDPLTKDEGCEHAALYARNAFGQPERIFGLCLWCRLAALERQASLHNDQCATFEAKIVELERALERTESHWRQELEIYKSTSHEPKALPDAVCLSCGEKINWVDQPCMRASSETFECPDCKDTGQIPVGLSGKESDGNAMEFEDCNCRAPSNAKECEGSPDGKHQLNKAGYCWHCDIQPQNTGESRE